MARKMFTVSKVDNNFFSKTYHVTDGNSFFQVKESEVVTATLGIKHTLHSIKVGDVLLENEDGTFERLTKPWWQIF